MMGADLADLRAAATCVQRRQTELATFSLVARRLPPRQGFLVAAGLADVVRIVTELGFDDDDLLWLRGRGFDDAALAALAHLRFTGDVWAVPEGHIVFAQEPLLEITAPLPEASALGTLLQRRVACHRALATKAARCALAAAGRAQLLDVAVPRARDRRVHDGLTAARAAAIAGFAGTSNLDAARRLGLAGVGTMAHSYVQALPAVAGERWNGGGARAVPVGPGGRPRLAGGRGSSARRGGCPARSRACGRAARQPGPAGAVA
jgi:nicotinate phosphoribosyltransferase